MVPNNATEPNLWNVRVESEGVLSDSDRELIVELVNEIAWRNRDTGIIILHDVIDSERDCELLVEVNPVLLEIFLEEMQDNLSQRIVATKVEPRAGDE